MYPAVIMPPITTPFSNGALAESKLTDNIVKWNETKLSGYLVLGSNGEAVYLSEKEKLRVVEVARDAIPRERVMLVGTGMEATKETIGFTNSAARLGADLALVVTPSYFKTSMKADILYNHFVAVADSVSIPILLYNVPQFTGINMEPDLVARLSTHDNIRGIKDSSGNIDQLTRIIHLCSKDFAVFVGSAPVLFPALCVGACGGILAVANVVPHACTLIQELYDQGKLAAARAAQNRLTPLAKAVTTTYGIGGLKMAMDMAGYFGGDPRAPLVKPGKDVADALKRLFNQLDTEE